MSRRGGITAFVCVAVALAVCAAWYVSSGAVEHTRALEPDVGEAPREESSPADLAAPIMKPLASRVLEPESTATRTSVVLDLAAVNSLPDDLWVAGRFELPAGTPADENAFVLVHTTRDPPRRVELDANGRFRFALDLARSFAKLEVRGRNVYSTKSLGIDATGQPVDLVLRPALGFLLRVRLVTSAVALARGVDLAHAKVLARPTGYREKRVEVFADANGLAELGGLDSVYKWTVRVELDGYAVTRSDGHEATPAGALELDLPIWVSPVVSGVVRDERDAPIEGALVKLAIED